MSAITSSALTVSSATSRCYFVGFAASVRPLDEPLVRDESDGDADETVGSESEQDAADDIRAFGDGPDPDREVEERDPGRRSPGAITRHGAGIGRAGAASDTATGRLSVG